MKLVVFFIAVLSVLLAVAQEAPHTWRRGKLQETGRPYWWRPMVDSDDPEISLTEPPDAWKLGRLDSGAPYLWRTTLGGEPEVQLWRKSRLDSGAPFWWRSKGKEIEEVRLTDPHDKAVSPGHDEL